MEMEEKERIRKWALQNRRALEPEERLEKSARIQDALLALPEYKAAAVVMTYMNFQDEAETSRIALETLKAGKRLLVPFCRQREIVACEIEDIDRDVAPGKFGIREPVKNKIKAVPPRQIDLIIVPGLAFDLCGNRIGFGQGYYDRFLPKVRQDALIVGIAFACQIVKEIPAEEHDIKMSLVLTEDGVVDKSQCLA